MLRDRHPDDTVTMIESEIELPDQASLAAPLTFKNATIQISFHVGVS